MKKLLHSKVILITITGAQYGGNLAKINNREVWLSHLLIFNKDGCLVAAPKSRNSRRWPIKKVANIKKML